MIGLAFVGFEFGFVVLVLVLLNVRDRRRARAFAAVLGACGIPRDCFALRVHTSLLSRRTLAVLDIPPWVAVDVWPMLGRLVDVLPRDIEVVVDMRLDGLPVTIALSRRPDPLEAPSSAAVRRARPAVNSQRPGFWV